MIMLASQAAGFRHPTSGVPLALRIDRQEGDQIIEGVLTGGGDEFQIVRGIPRFCPEENYANSFGFQWQKFSTTQLDSKARWGGQSERRLYEETNWPRHMEGQSILEAGSGMGRFTEVLAKTGASVYTFDYSAAIDANAGNIGAAPNVSFAQADIYSPPYAHGSFDKVLCLGVIQHCPSPARAFASLTRFLKPGGEIVIDVYRLYWKSFLGAKYYLRPVTRLMPPKQLYHFCRLHVGCVYPLTGFLQRIIGRRGRSVSWMLGMADYRGLVDRDEAGVREMSLLDTFDMLAPAYDRPQTIRSVRRWFDRAGLVDVVVKPGWNGLEAKGRKPL